MGAGRANRVISRRPVLLLAVFLAGGVVLGRFAYLTTFYIAAAVALAAAAVCLFVCRCATSSWTALVLVGAALGMLGAFLASSALTTARVRTGEELSVRGHVITAPYINDYGSVVCYIDDVHIGGEPCGNLKLYVSAPALLKCGDVIETVAEVVRPKGVRNPGGFDERLYLLSEGIVGKAYADSVDVTGYAGTPAVWFSDARAALGQMLDRVFPPDTAPVARGILLGDRQRLDEDTVGAFRDTGMSHLLAISGLHAVILIAAMHGFFRLLRLGRTPMLTATLIFIAVYACVTGLTPSIVRASIMAAVVLLEKHFGRQTDTLSALALAFLVSLLLRPLDLFTAGFQLSYGAVFGILTLGAQLKHLLDRASAPARLSEAVSASVGATAGTFPILAASFNRFSPLGILVNIVVVPLAGVATVLTFVTLLWTLTVGVGAQYLALAPAFAIRAMLAIINAVAVLPFAAVTVASPPWHVVLAAFLALFITSKYVLVSVRLKAALCAGLAAVVALVAVLSVPAGMTLTFLDVGQGDATFIRTKQGGEYFVDGGRTGSADEVVSFTVRSGITPDAAFVTHTDDDHLGGLLALYDAGLLNTVYCSRQEQAAVAAAMPKARVVPLCAGDRVLLDDETTAVVLYPYTDTQAENKNELSLVLLVESGGRRVLLTGDISGATETVLLTNTGHVDIYKAAHHGSPASSYRLPLSVLLPDYAVVSAGDNSYGHPHPRVLQNLEDYAEQVFVTRDDGAVVFSLEDAISVRTYGEQE